MKKIGNFIIAILSLSTLYAQNNNEAISFDVSYKGDVAGNLCGGLQKGATYLGYAQLGCSFDVEKMGWWRGGEFFIGGGNTHGGEPSAKFIGDHQVADNIEAGNHTFLQELWFKQQLGSFTATVGLQDFNADYAVCEAAGLFFNSSFGVHSALSSNMDLPIFPITSWAVNLQCDIGEHHSIRAALFDTPLDFEQNPFNLTWYFNRQKGGLIAAEYEYRSKIRESLEGCYAMGICYQTAEQKWSFHLSASQTVWQTTRRTLDLFFMGSICQKEEDNNHLHFGGGIVLTGVFSKTLRDSFGVGVTSALMSGDKSNETSIELTYRYQLHKNIVLQPDLQYIINPSDATAGNALFMALRIEVGLFQVQ